jgi:NADP-dependent 3-hydroxy acid dehydrogenase YdfG
MARQPRSLDGKVAAITGAARGIGRATAQAFVAEGMRVAIGDLDLATAQKTAAELGAGTLAFELNVCERESIKRFVDATEAQLGPIDVFVNNAGIMQLGEFLAEDDATARRQVDINVHGVMFGMKEILPRMTARGRGHLVNIASSAGKAGFPGGATYCGTKHFVVGVSEAVRQELRGTGVEVSCVMPGVVNTELSAGLSPARGIRNVDPEDVASAIVDALRSPHFDVFVPRALGPINRVLALAPRSLRESTARALKADRVLAQHDVTARRAYELRATQSEPGLDAGETPRELETTAGAS